MAIRLNNEEIDAIALRVIVYLRQGNFMIIKNESSKEWVTPEEAARILNISRDRVYHIKDHLTHRKGNSPKSRLFFKRSTLIDDYMNM
jgi:hypothetical protein